MNDKTARFIAVVLSGYVKRVLEAYYDDLFKTPLGQQAQALDRTTKHLIEGGLYSALAYSDQRFADDSPWKKLAFEVLKDAPSELSKRLLNGVRHEVANDLTGDEVPENQSALRKLLSLDDKVLEILLRWGAEADESNFAVMIQRVADLTVAEVEKLDRLTPEQRKAVLNHK